MPISTVRDLVEVFAELPVLDMNKDMVYELELRFGTLNSRKYDKAKPITRTTFDQVSSWIRSLGYEPEDPKYILRISSASFHNIRIEVSSVALIQKLCKSEILSDDDIRIDMTKKEAAMGASIVDVHDFNCRLALSTEEMVPIKSDQARKCISTYGRAAKVYRLIHRRVFRKPGVPYRFELSVTRQSDPSNDIKSSNIFSKSYRYEIEVEFDVDERNTPTAVDDYHRRVKEAITIVSSGYQMSAFPIPEAKRANVIDEFYKITYLHAQTKYGSAAFIGPQPVTLQTDNIQLPEHSGNTPCIQRGYSVSEKADGERALLYIADDCRAYIITNDMQVRYTGTETKHEKYKGTIFDGEYIRHNKHKEYINLYMAFDIYYVGGIDVRSKPLFVPGQRSSRYTILNGVVNDISLRRNGAVVNGMFMLRVKIFEFATLTNSIFKCSNKIMKHIEMGDYEYETDGLIFTPMLLGAGATAVDENVRTVGRRTWFYAFKWKPPHMNTIDFLVTTIKDHQNKEAIKESVEQHSGMTEVSYYKTLQLRVGYNEHTDGFINPCAMIRTTAPQVYDSKTQVAALFYPDNPSSDSAHICQIRVVANEYGTYEMRSEEGDIIEDRTVVECRFDGAKSKGWQWIPMRVRHDKTLLYRSSTHLMGPNSFRVVNSNWKTIHFPITESVIRGVENIPTINNVDIYYALNANVNTARSLRDFHNRFVKSYLITKLVPPKCKLIDVAVGRAGDMYKWKIADVHYVLGVDIDKDGLTNRMNGACARFLQFKRDNPTSEIQAMFVHGDSTKSLRTGEAAFDEVGKIDLRSAFGIDMHKQPDDKMARFSVFEDGADILSIQFALHYMFSDKSSLYGFMRNCSECLKTGGVVVGTTYDGARVFDLLSTTSVGEDYVIREKDDEILCRISRKYDAAHFVDDEGGLGYAISVWMSTIGHTITEYLVNHTYLRYVMEEFGFEPVESDVLNPSTGSFELLNREMMNYTPSHYGKAAAMSEGEKKLSFLNNYFAYRKIREVDCDIIMKAHAASPPTVPQSDQPKTHLKNAKKIKLRRKI